MTTSAIPTRSARARDAFAATVASVAGRASRAAHLGGGSSIPGVLLDVLSPGFAGHRAARLPGGVVLVSGTNGKTTVASMIRSILRATGDATVGNDTGANLHRGIATALLEMPRDARSAVFEVDEAALPATARELAPRVLVLTNVFRDQMDRFGETERVVGLLGSAAAMLPVEGTVVANADDPALWAAVGERAPLAFGVTLPEATAGESVAFAREAELCPRCGARLVYDAHTIAHLGVWRCDACGLARPRPAIVGEVVSVEGLRSVRVRVDDDVVEVPTGGVHSAYNAVAALAAAQALGLERRTAIEALERFQPRFGRTERLEVDGRTVWLTLMKNPAGADVLVRAIASDPRMGAVVLAVNDGLADGRDISWIWDVDVERLVAEGHPFVAAGARADDMAVRVRYAGGEVDAVRPDLTEAIRGALEATPAGRDPVVLASYTAMLDLRAAFAGRRGRLHDAA
ncbi:MAG: MurT ligase domain-containing protein [Planctomycetaceae bacterium]